MGCVYAACLAQWYDVVGFDEDLSKVRNLNKGKPPIYEPGLEELIRTGLASGRLRFIEDIIEAAQNSDFILITYDTPLNSRDEPDTSIVFRAAKRLKEIKGQAVLVISSQVPVGTCDRIHSMLSTSVKSVAYVPENLRLGLAIDRFMKPDMIIIGAPDSPTSEKVKTLFSPIRTRIIEMNLRSAEMTKHALNAFLGTSISFANEIGNLCDIVGADALKVGEALKADSRIGQKALLRPGLGFAGGTLARDLRAIQAVGKKHHFRPELLNAVLRVNQKQNSSIAKRISHLIGGVRGRTVTVFGLTYKSGTNTLRRTASLEIIRQLQRGGAHVRAYDPKVSKDELAYSFSFFNDPYEACDGADILVILTDWPEFGELEFARLRQVMKRPIIFDAQNMLDKARIETFDIKYVGIGRGAKAS
jgi:UDPglucose 6-dehydrogenase